MRPRKLASGDAFTWRFKTKDYWEAIRAPRPIETAEELMRLHEPWVTSSASEVLRIIAAHGGLVSLDEEGLLIVDTDEADVQGLNAELASLGCVVSEHPLHTV
ncbi:MAG TPA: hypothetical protein ENO24_02015 [Chloroflexi bacterium]|nr:hypothetical protein [Chloroflexota bacterium]